MSRSLLNVILSLYCIHQPSTRYAHHCSSLAPGGLSAQQRNYVCREEMLRLACTMLTLKWRNMLSMSPKYHLKGKS